VGFSPTTPQKAAGCRMEPPVSEPSAQMASPAATAAVEPPDERHGPQVPGIVGGAEGGVLRAGPHGELVQVGLADEHAARRLQAVYDGSAVGRHEPFQDARRAGRLGPLGAEVVFQGDWDAGQRPERLAARTRGVHGVRLRLGDGLGHGDVSLDVALDFADAV